MQVEHPDVPVPEPLFLGELEGATVACERRLVGLTAPQLTGDHDAARNLFADTGLLLSRLVVEPEARIDDETFEELVGAKLDLVARYARVASTVRRIAELRLRARDELVGRTLPLVLYHGDLRSKHVQVDEAGHALGLLDWGTAEDRGLPYFDLFHLIVHERKQEADLTVAEAWTLAREREALREHEKGALDDYADRLDLDGGFRRVVEALYGALAAATAEANWDFSRPRWAHRHFGL
jgi:hypothetical protein